MLETNTSSSTTLEEAPSIAPKMTQISTKYQYLLKIVLGLLICWESPVITLIATLPTTLKLLSPGFTTTTTLTVTMMVTTPRRTGTETLRMYMKGILKVELYQCSNIFEVVKILGVAVLVEVVRCPRRGVRPPPKSRSFSNALEMLRPRLHWC